MTGPLIGLGISTAATAGSDPVRDARAAEAHGFDVVSASDHLHGTSATYETWTMLTWVAAATSRIRVMTRVLAVPYRHPAVVAKMAETLDRLSGGRLLLGLGGGAVDAEFRGFGVGARSPRDKVDGLAEAVRVTRGLWSEPSFTFAGRLYRTDAAQLEPKPGRPIPIWLGTYGPRALDLTGRLADGWIPSMGYAPPDQVAVMRQRVLDAAAAAGRDPAGITCAYNVEIELGTRTVTSTDRVSGPPDHVVERLLGFLDLGFDALNLIVAGPDPVADTERLAREVLPALRAAGSRTP